MSEKITVPTLGESVTEATVSKWLKSKGEKVIADEPIVELETDKVNVEVPAPSNGILGKIDVKEGETVNVGSVLGIISNENIDHSKTREVKSYDPPKKELKGHPKLFDEKKSSLQPKKNIKKPPDDTTLELNNESVEDELLILKDVHEEKKIEKKAFNFQKETQISPAARKMASEANLDLEKVKKLFVPLDTFIERGGTFQEHYELKYLNYGYLEDNHIWENEEFVNIKKIGISLSTEKEIHSKIFIRS